jgi:predicted ATPase
MIDRVKFENFKSLAAVTLELGRLTALVGANGCGKTSVLDGIRLLAQTGVKKTADRDKGLGRFATIYGGLNAPSRLVYRGGSSMSLAMRASDGDELYVQVRGADAEPEFDVAIGPADLLHCTVPPGAAPRTPSWDDVFTVLDHSRVKRFASVAYLHLDATTMVKTSVLTEEVPRMRSDGSRLASVLAWMKGAAEDELSQITSDLARVVPGVKRIRTLRERVPVRRISKVEIDGQPVWRPVDETKIGDRFSLEFDHGPEVPADLLSEGTVLALGLLAKLREPKRPRLLLLDDIDRGLHFEAQVSLVRVLRDLMELDPELQIVCTTHSPYLLDLFGPAEVRVLALDSERRTHARALTEHPEFGKWQFGTQTGELWASLGEGWVTGEPSR